MRKGTWWAAAFVMLLWGGTGALWASGVGAADSNRVAMNDQLKFAPDDITVSAGTTVVWHNDGYVQHDVNADNGSFKSDGLIDRGGDFSFKFTAPGDFTYYCSPHKDAGMKGVVHVTGGAAAPPPPAAAGTSPGPSSGTTATSAPPPAGATTTTTRPGATASGQSTTTTTAPAPGGVTSTTQAPSVTPTSAPEGGGVTSTSAGATPSEESAGAAHGSEGGTQKKHHKSSPIGIAFASVSTLLLVAIAGKLLASKP